MNDPTIFFDPAGEPHVKPDDVQANWRPSVYGLARNEVGDVLMIKPRWNNQWELPGGGLDLGEDFPDALKREFFEETGYQCELASDLPIHLRQSQMYLRKSKIFVHTICLYYPVTIMDTKRDLSVINQEDPDEVADMQWVSFASCNEQTCHPVAWSLLQTLSSL